MEKNPYKENHVQDDESFLFKEMVDQILKDTSQNQISMNVLKQLEPTSQGLADNQSQIKQLQLQTSRNKISNSKIELKDQIQVDKNNHTRLNKLQGVAAEAFSSSSDQQNEIDEKGKIALSQDPNQNHILDLPSQNSTVMRLSIQQFLNDIIPEKRIQYTQQLQLRQSILNNSSNSIGQQLINKISLIFESGEKFVQYLFEKKKAQYNLQLQKSNIEVYNQISIYSDIINSNSANSVIIIRKLRQEYQRKRPVKSPEENQNSKLDFLGPRINDPAAAPSPDLEAQLQMDLAQIQRKYNSPKALIHINQALNKCCEGTFEHATALHRKSVILQKMGRFQEALQCQLKCLKLVQKIPNNKLSIARIKAFLALLYIKYSDQKQFLKYSFEALNYFQSQGYDKQAQMIYTNLGVFYDQKNPELTYILHKRALQICKINEKNSISFGVLLFNYGRSLVNTKRFVEALPIFQKALTIFQQKKGKEHLILFHTLNQLAQCQFCLGNFQKALNYLQRSLSIYKNALDNVEKSEQKIYIASRYITQIYQLEMFLNARLNEYSKILGPYRVFVNYFMKDLSKVIQRVKQYERRMKSTIFQQSEVV